MNTKLANVIMAGVATLLSLIGAIVYCFYHYKNGWVIADKWILFVICGILTGLAVVSMISDSLPEILYVIPLGCLAVMSVIDFIRVIVQAVQDDYGVSSVLSGMVSILLTIALCVGMILTEVKADMNPLFGICPLAYYIIDYTFLSVSAFFSIFSSLGSEYSKNSATMYSAAWLADLAWILFFLVYALRLKNKKEA